MLWEQTMRGNLVLRGDCFYVSYNAFRDPLSLVLAKFGLGPETDKGETALVVGDSYFILNGDFRQEYEAAMLSVESAMEVYLRNRSQHGSCWTSE